MKKIFLTIVTFLLFTSASPSIHENEVVRAFANGYMQAIIESNQLGEARTQEELHKRLYKSMKWYSERLGLKYSDKEIKELLIH